MLFHGKFWVLLEFCQKSAAINISVIENLDISRETRDEHTDFSQVLHVKNEHGNHAKELKNDNKLIWQEMSNYFSQTRMENFALVQQARK